MDNTTKNIDTQRNKELFEYEMTEVLLKLKGEFSAISKKENSPNVVELSLKTEVNDMPEIDIEQIELDVPKVVAVCIPQNFSVNLPHLHISSFEEKQLDISVSFENIEAQKITTLIPHIDKYFYAAFPSINITPATIKPLKSTDIKIGKFDYKCFVIPLTIHFQTTSCKPFDYITKDIKVDLESQNVNNNISLPIVKPMQFVLGMKMSRALEVQNVIVPEVPNANPVSPFTAKSLETQNISVPNININLSNIEINDNSNVQNSDDFKKLSSVLSNLNIDYSENLKDIYSSLAYDFN